jgi:hypothetical protein
MKAQIQAKTRIRERNWTDLRRPDEEKKRVSEASSDV